ncbi:hypothetical protein BP6252_08294 [Coleophoma cylindrospora]|uniref:SCP domain-containing protein n=1 Tax=Coleophoma cylindrospora TaxID=1849047 RepID=A0A3D8R639_9HELO|nr:hypothetical protein BP6252_08294 [Coleophoma cylindrospora]
MAAVDSTFLFHHQAIFSSLLYLLLLTTSPTLYFISSNIHYPKISFSIMRSFALLTLLVAQAATNMASPLASISMSTVGSPVLATPPPAAGSKMIRDAALEKRDAAEAEIFKRATYSETGVNYHNAHRSNHSAPAVTWSVNLASYASSTAATCVFAHNLTAGGGGYGQNLAAYGGSGDITTMSTSLLLARSISMQWYNGEFPSFLPSYYGQATPDLTNFGAWGHFTQVLWKTSTQIGCATQYCPAGTIFQTNPSWFTVCDYSGPGNSVGSFGANVGQPLGKPTLTA